jgi:hypothetical protein
LNPGFTPENVAAFENALQDIDPILGLLSDGVAEEDIEKLIRERAQKRSVVEENDKTVLPMIYNDLTSNKMHNETMNSPEYQDFIGIQAGNHPEITSERLQSIIAPHMKRGSDEGGFISKGELGQIVQALRDLIPALKEANTIVVEQRDG